MPCHKCLILGFKKIRYIWGTEPNFAGQKDRAYKVGTDPRKPGGM